MKEEKFPHTRKPLHWQRQGVGQGGGSFGASEESAATGVQRAKQRDPHTENWCRPTLNGLRGLLAHLPGWGVGLGAEALASEVRCQGEGLGWLREHSLKGASVPQLAGMESGKKSGTA